MPTMFINLNSDGTVARTLGTRAFKGSNVNSIALFAPFSKTANILVHYLKPDGTKFDDILTYQDFDPAEKLNLFSVNLKTNVTEVSGKVTFSFEIRAVTDDGTEVNTTASAFLTVEENNGVGVELPAEDVFLTAVNQAQATADGAVTKNTEQDGRLDIAETDIAGLKVKNTEQDTALSDYQTTQATKDASQDQALADEITNRQNAITALSNAQAVKNAEQDTAIASKVDTVGYDVSDAANPKITYTKGAVTTPIAITGLITNLELNQTDGVLTITFAGGATKTIDFATEFVIAQAGSYYDNNTRDLMIKLANDQLIAVPLDDIYTPITALQDQMTSVTAIANTNVTDIDNIKKSYLKKDGTVFMDAQYAPIEGKQIADKDYVDNAILGVTGVDISSLVTQAELDEVVADVTTPSYATETFDKASNKPVNAVKLAPQELTSFEGNTVMPLTTAEADKATWKVSDTLKNYITYSGQYPLMNEYVKKIVLKTLTYSNNVANNSADYYCFITNVGSLGVKTINGTNNASVDGFPYAYNFTGDSKHYFLYNSILYLFVLKSEIDIITVDINGVTTSDLGKKFATYLKNNNYNGTFELSVPNPKTKTLLVGDINSQDANYYYINKPVDMLTNGLATIDGVNCTVATYIQYPIASGSPTGKTLTYQLTTPRLAEVTGIESAKNTKITIGSTYTQLTGDYRSVGTAKDKAVYKNGSWVKQGYVSDDIDLSTISITPVYVTRNNVYCFTYVNFVTVYNIKPYANFIINTFLKFSAFDGDYRLSYLDSKNLVLSVEKTLVDNQTGTIIQDKLKAYLNNMDGNGKKAVFIGEKSTMTETVITVDTNSADDDFVFDKDSTINLESGTTALPKLVFNCSLDTPAQITLLSKDALEKSQQIHNIHDTLTSHTTSVSNHETRIGSIETATANLSDDEALLRDISDNIGTVNVTDLKNDFDSHSTDTTVHHEINNAAANANELWSASKVKTELDTKAPSALSNTVDDHETRIDTLEATATQQSTTITNLGGRVAAVEGEIDDLQALTNTDVLFTGNVVITSSDLTGNPKLITQNIDISKYAYLIIEFSGDSYFIDMIKMPILPTSYTSFPIKGMYVNQTTGIYINQFSIDINVTNNIATFRGHTPIKNYIYVPIVSGTVTGKSENPTLYVKRIVGVKR